MKYHPAFLNDGEQVNPTIVDELADARVRLDHTVQRILRCFDEDVELQRLVDEARSAWPRSTTSRCCARSPARVTV